MLSLTHAQDSINSCRRQSKFIISYYFRPILFITICKRPRRQVTCLKRQRGKIFNIVNFEVCLKDSDLKTILQKIWFSQVLLLKLNQFLNHSSPEHIFNPFKFKIWKIYSNCAASWDLSDSHQLFLGHGTGGDHRAFVCFPEFIALYVLL